MRTKNFSALTAVKRFCSKKIRLRSDNNKKSKSVKDKQAEYIKSKIDDIENLSREDVVSLGILLLS